VNTPSRLGGLTKGDFVNACNQRSQQSDYGSLRNPPTNYGQTIACDHERASFSIDKTDICKSRYASYSYYRWFGQGNRKNGCYYD
jgi:hypothetical protein